MNDGTTGIRVTPISEADMTLVQDILRRAADAIVGMSQLHADVDMLRQTVQSLQADADRLRNQNNALDEALAHSRTVRDDQAQTISSLSTKLQDITNDRDDLKKANEYNQTHIDTISLKLSAAQTERDDHGFRVMELEEALRLAQVKLDKIAQAHADVFGAMQAATPTPVVEPTNTVQEFHPLQTSDPSLPTRTYHGLQWAPGYSWDSDKQEYYTETPF